MFAIPPGERVENGKLGHQSSQVSSRLYSQNTLLFIITNILQRYLDSGPVLKNIEMKPGLGWTPLQGRKWPLPLLLLPLLLLSGAASFPVPRPPGLRLKSQHVLDVEVSLLTHLLLGEELGQSGLVLLDEMIGVEVVQAVVPVAVQGGVSPVSSHPPGNVNYQALEMLRVSSPDSSITSPNKLIVIQNLTLRNAHTICLSMDKFFTKLSQ